MQTLSIENHPGDSRMSVREDGTVQTLTSRIGTGGGNQPMVLLVKEAADDALFERMGRAEQARPHG